MDREQLFKAILEDSIIFFPHLKDGLKESLQNNTKYHLSPLQFMTMGLLLVDGNKNGLTMNKIANSLKISKQQCTKLIDYLVDINLVERDINPTNRREIIVKVSLFGLEQFNNLKAKKEEELKEKYSSLSNDEIESLYYHIKAIKEILQKVEK